mmetsp:Transcript_32916/g.79628  ORF Transcript_32916/g.79628 Transcript_32916/m.79628 type:complete len:87 (-) Transcript_32916:462-722(-)
MNLDIGSRPGLLYFVNGHIASRGKSFYLSSAAGEIIAHQSEENDRIRRCRYYFSCCLEYEENWPQQYASVSSMESNILFCQKETTN